MKKITTIVVLIIIFSFKENNKNEIGGIEVKTTNHVNKLKNKSHMLLPNKISIQLKDKNGTNLKLKNVLCHLNIYIDKASYHTYSFIPTNSNGIVTLTREQMIQNTELKFDYDEKLPLDKRPVKFEFFVMDPSMIDRIISSMKNYLSIDAESIKADLKTRGLNDAQIEPQMKMIMEKMESDKKLYKFLKKNQNAALDYSNGEKMISGYWDNEIDYNYELK